MCARRHITGDEAEIVWRCETSCHSWSASFCVSQYYFCCCLFPRCRSQMGSIIKYWPAASIPDRVTSVLYSMNTNKRKQKQRKRAANTPVSWSVINRHTLLRPSQETGQCCHRLYSSLSGSHFSENLILECSLPSQRSFYMRRNSCMPSVALSEANCTSYPWD